MHYQSDTDNIPQAMNKINNDTIPSDYITNRERRRYQAHVTITKFSERPKDKDPWIALLYGDSGSGKTWFAGTAKRALYVNIGKGIATCTQDKYLQKYPSFEDNIIVDISRKENETSSTRANVFHTVYEVIDDMLERHGDDFDTVILDDSTYLEKAAYALLYEEAAKHSTVKAKDKVKAKGSFLALEMPDYKAINEGLEWFLATYTEIFIEQKKNFLMLAHSKVDLEPPKTMGEQHEIKLIRPNFPGLRFGPRAPGYFDDVLYCELVQPGPVQRIYVEGHEGRINRTRNDFSGLCERNKSYIANPTYDDMLNHYYNKSERKETEMNTS